MGASCIVPNLYKLNIINNCKFNAGGIQEVWIGLYNKNFYSQLTIQGNKVTDMNTPVDFQLVDFDRTSTSYKETYDPTTKKYNQTFVLDHLRYDYDKRDIIDALIKSRIIIIYKSSNGDYYIVGEKTGLSQIDFQTGSSTVNSKNSYLITFNGKSDYLALGVDPEVLKKTVVCDDLNDQLALSSILYIKPYWDCFIGDLNDFIDPV